MNPEKVHGICVRQLLFNPDLNVACYIHLLKLIHLLNKIRQKAFEDY